MKSSFQSLVEMTDFIFCKEPEDGIQDDTETLHTGIVQCTEQYGLKNEFVKSQR